MFARANFVQNSLSKVGKVAEKTDKELLDEIREEGKQGIPPVTDEFGEGYFGKKYAHYVHWCREMTWQGGKYEMKFTLVIIITIILAGVLVGLDTYPQMQGIMALAVIEIIIVTIFVAEVVMKICAEGTKPWKFFTDGEAGLWNSFDFLVVFFSMPFFSDIFSETPAIRIVSRLFRLVRVTKIFNQIPALAVIVKGLVGGLRSIIYVVMLLLLIYYMYAVFGVYMFKENDPFFFRSVPIALLTLFRVCTLENWGDNMYINMYGCKEFDGDVYLNTDDTDDNEWDVLPSFYRCEHPEPQFWFSLFFFVSFIVISSLVMLSLFIGVITMSMQDSLNDMRREVEESNRKKRLMKAEEEMEKLALKNTAMTIAARMGGSTMGSRLNNATGSGKGGSAKKINHEDAESDTASSDESSDDEPHFLKKSMKSLSKTSRSFGKSFSRFGKSMGFISLKKARTMSAKELKKLRDMAEMKSLMMQAWSGTRTSADYHHDLDLEQEGKLEKYIRHAGMHSRNLVEHQYFTNSITAVILITAVMVGVETDYRNDENSMFFDVVENVIFSIFAAEVILRITADDFHLREYFKSSWNVFDFFVVVFSKVPGGGTVVVLLRLVRLLRVLKLVKSLPQLSVIVTALLMGISSIGYISVIMFLTFYLFGILGVMLFSENDDFNFGNLHRALIALFKIATLDDWGGALYINLYGCDVYPPYFIDRDLMFRCPKPSASPVATCIYFVIFVLIGSLVMITLFVGVVTTSMEQATEMQMMEFEIENKIRELCHERSVTHTQLEIYRRVFAMLDLDGGGTIEGEELKMGLQAVNIECTDEQLEVWMIEVDENSDGVIDLIEFIVFMTNMKKKALEKQEKKAMEKGAAAFLKMRKRAQDRKAGTLKNDPRPDLAINAANKGAPSKRRASVLGSLGLASDGVAAAPPSPGILARGASFFGSPTTLGKSHGATNKDSPGMFSRMASAVGFGTAGDETSDASDFSHAEKADKSASKKPIPAAKPSSKGVVAPAPDTGDKYKASDKSPSSSDGADVTADLTDNTSATSMKAQPLDADDSFMAEMEEFSTDK